MEKAVVRRGVGAIVLALVAALLLGYLLKGKAPDRKKVVNMETKPSEIQIFPRGKSADGTSGAAVAGASADAVTPAAMKGDAAVSSGSSADEKAAGIGAIAAAGAAAAGAFKIMGEKGTDAAKGAGQAVKEGAQAATSTVAGVGKPEAVRGAFSGSKDQLTDPVSGNAATGTGKVVVDGAGQAVVGKATGVKETPAQFSVRAPKAKEVRPSINRSARAHKPKAVASKKAAPKKTPARSNARLVGEKKLAPVGSKSYAKKSASKSKGTKKVATSRGAKAKPAKKSKRVASSKAKRSSRNKVARKVASKRKAAVAKRATKKPVRKSTGRNKYTVQLLATSSSKKANSLRNTLKKEGYPAYVTSGKRAGKNFYRVRLGGFNGKAAAIKKQSSLKRRYRKNAYVQSSVVVKK